MERSRHEELASMIQTDVVAKMATKDDFRILVDEIRLLRDDFKDMGTIIKSLVSINVGRDKLRFDVVTVGNCYGWGILNRVHIPISFASRNH